MKTRTIGLLILLTFGCILTLLGGMIYKRAAANVFDQQMAVLVKPGTVDCSTNNDYPKSNACAVEAVKKGKKVAFKFQSGHFIFGSITDSKGQLFNLQYTRRFRWGITDWEMMEIYRGKLQIKKHNGVEHFSMTEGAKVVSYQQFWPLWKRIPVVPIEKL